jgi:hypothetical protein
MLVMRRTRARSTRGRSKSGRSLRHFDRVVLIALGVMLVDSSARAQDQTPFPEFDGKRVYVAGVPDQYKGLAGQIAELEKSSKQTYYVAVVKSSGHGESSGADYVKSMYATWRRQAESRGLALDPERSIVVVVAMERQQVAVRPGTALRDLGLDGATVHRDLVGPGSTFVKLAKAERYPEAIAALLNETDRWIRARDVTTARAGEIQSSSSPPVRSTQPEAPRPGPGTQTANGPRESSARLAAIGIGVALLAIILAVGVLFWLAHQRVRSRVARRIKDVRSKATDVMDRLDALKERLKLLPTTDPDFQAPMDGETLTLYNTVQAALGKLWDRWLQVMDTLDKAQKLSSATASPLQRKKLLDAEALLDQEDLFEEIEAQSQACVRDMDRLNQAHESARGLVQAIDEAKAQLDTQLAAVEKLGLPTAPYKDDLIAIGAGTTRAGTRLTADPIGAVSALEELRARSEGLLNRLGRVAAMFQEAQQAGTSLEGVKRLVANHRAQGLELGEEGGNPDHFLGQGSQAHSQALMALRAGNPDAAAKALETVRSGVEQGQAVIEQVRKAKAFCDREQPGRVRETERLRAAMPQAESYFRELQQGFAPSSWQAVARNLDQARALLATFDRMAEDAASASAGSQKYLAAARQLEQLAQQQQIALRLMSGLGEQLNGLSAIRAECQKRRGEMEAIGRRVEGYFRQHDQAVGEIALGSRDSALRDREEVLAGFQGPRSDWPSVSRALASAFEEFAIAQSQAEADIRAHEQLSDEYGRARQELDRVARLLSGRREDRVAANQHFRAAAEVLDRVGLDLSSSRGEWTRLLERVRGAGEDLEQAERLARDDIRLAGQAESEVSEAVRSIRQAHGYFAMGVTVDTSGAEAAVDQAHQLLQAQEYEQAIQCAGAAVQQARQAYQEAVQQASWRETQADADRRRRQAGNDGSLAGAVISAGATAAAVAAGVILDRVVQAATESPPAPSEHPAMPQPDPDVGVGTWSDDAGQGNW